MTEKLEMKIIELIDDYLKHGIRFDSHGILCDHHLERFGELIEAIRFSGDSGRSDISEAINGILIDEEPVAKAINNLSNAIENKSVDSRFLSDLIQAIKQAGKHYACNDKFTIAGQ